MQDARAFAVNILDEAQSEWSDRFAGRHGELEDRFFDMALTEGQAGAPMINAALASLDCSIAQQHDAGDHTIFVGRVQSVALREESAPPLLYFDAAYRRLAEPSEDS